MPLLPKEHISFLYNDNKSNKKSSSRRQSQLSPTPAAATAASPPCLMASVACRDGFINVPRSYQLRRRRRRRRRSQNHHITTETSSTTTTTITTTTDENNNNSDDDDNDEFVITNESYSLFYRIFRPQSLSHHTTSSGTPPSRRSHILPKCPAPLIVLHGGPGVPSDYLYPLVDYVPFRSILFYDQIGCGRSFQPRNASAYSLSYAVDDLEQFLTFLKITKCHIYGHSFGGLLAFEYLKRLAHRRQRQQSSSSSSSSIRCLSVTLSSTPTSIDLVTNESHRLLINDCRGDGRLFHLRHCCRKMSSSLGGLLVTPSSSSSSSLTNDDDGEDELLPPPLREAYAHAGRVWRGTAAVVGYEASSSSSSSLLLHNDQQQQQQQPLSLPPLLIMRGEYDFVTAKCVEGWKTVWGVEDSNNNNEEKEESDAGGSSGRVVPVVEMVTLEGCSHYGLLENGMLYGRHLNNFLKRFDDL